MFLENAVVAIVFRLKKTLGPSRFGHVETIKYFYAFHIGKLEVFKQLPITAGCGMSAKGILG